MLSSRNLITATLALVTLATAVPALVLLTRGHDNTPIQIIPAQSVATVSPKSSGGSADRKDTSANTIDSSLVDLNTASFGLLTTLPGIGEVKAQAIIDYRESHGRFQSVEAVVEVQGIGPATLDKIRGLAAAGKNP